MGGLYQRALDYLHSQGNLRLVRPDDEDYDELPGTPAEREQIETEIRRATDDQRIVVGPDTFRIAPKRRGIRLPVLVNVFAVILIVLGVVFITRLLDQEEHSLVARSGALASAEGRLLSALRQESAARISEKEQEIAEIERRLAQVEAEREQIRGEAQARLQTREAELRAEFEAALEAERARLAAQNLTESERTELLAGFREQRQADLEQNLAQMQRDAIVELRAQEEALAALAGEYESILNATLAEREAELSGEREAAARELSSERAAAARRLDELRGQHDQRQLVLDQILGFYSQVREALADGSHEEATRHLASLREYLNTGPVSSMPELQRRRGVELFLVGTLEDRVARARSAETADSRSLVESAGMISRIGSLIVEAERQYELGNLASARELYAGALRGIPAVETGYTRITAIDAAFAAEADERVRALIAAGNEQYRDGAYEEAVATYAAALASLPSPDDRLVARLLDSGYQLLAADRLAGQADEIVVLHARLESTESLVNRLRGELEDTSIGLQTKTAELQATSAELRATVARAQVLQGRIREQRDLAVRIDAYRTAFGAAAAQRVPGPSVSALELLETKLLILRIVGSETVRADHPDLGDRLNAYVDALVAEQRTGATRAVILEVTGLLDDLTARMHSSAATAGELVRSYPALGAPELAGPTDRLMSGLRELVDPDVQ